MTNTSLTFEVFNEAPTKDTDILASTHASGTVPDGIYSFAWIAWHSVAETDNDLAGYVLVIPDEWQNVEVTAGGTGIFTANFTYPVNSLGSKAHPHHFALYCMSGATFEFGEVSTRAGVLAKDNSATTIYSTGTVEVTWDAAHSSATIGMFYNITYDLKDINTRTFDGSIVKLSYSYANPVEMVHFKLPFGAIRPNPGMTSKAVYNDIIKWAHYGCKIKIIDNGGEDAISTYYGAFEKLNYLGTVRKTNFESIDLDFLVENVTPNI